MGGKENAEQYLLEVIFTVSFLGKGSLGGNGARTYWRQDSRADRSSGTRTDSSEKINKLPENLLKWFQESGQRSKVATAGKILVRVRLLSLQAATGEPHTVGIDCMPELAVQLLAVSIT